MIIVFRIFVSMLIYIVCDRFEEVKWFMELFKVKYVICKWNGEVLVEVFRIE